MPSQPCLAGPFCLATHIQDGQPGPAGPLLAGACTRGPAVMFPSGLAFQLPPTKCTFTAVTHLSSRSDVGTSIATQKPRTLQYPREGPASLPHVGNLAFRETARSFTVWVCSPGKPRESKAGHAQQRDP